MRLDHLELVTSRENTLRGVSPAAQRARRTHCPAGHEFTPENTYTQPSSGQRKCRTCVRDRAAAANPGAIPLGQRTHCPQGHPYNTENTHVTKRGYRVCRACNAAHNRAAKARKRAAS